MKNIIILINIAIIIGIAAIFTDHENSKPDVSNQNQSKRSAPTKSGVAGKIDNTVPSDFIVLSDGSEIKSDEFVATFIREMAQARLMDLEEGKIAAQRSTTRDLKSYGTLMVNDQTEMLRELKKLAGLKNVSFSFELGPDNAADLKDLKEVHGASFDKKFIKRMTVAHKRDVKKFERATRSSDADVQVFATRYLPYVQAHLERIKALK
jgi:putative membrane protein